MIISIASGKGGTGKTTVALSLALSLPDVQLIDCDVEEPNLHLFLSPRVHRTLSVSLPVPGVDESLCTYCGKCAEVCKFNALAVVKNQVLIFPELCHGCGGCSLLCPERAIRETPREIGVIQEGSYNGLAFVQGILNVGEPMPTPIIREEKKLIDRRKTVILDCSPGTSCPVIEGVRGSDFCLLVTENTPFGLNDLELAVEMVRALGISPGVFLNHSDLGDRKVKDYCERENIPLLAELPHDRRIAEVYSRGEIVVEKIPAYRDLFHHLWQKVQKIVSGGSQDGLERNL